MNRHIEAAALAFIAVAICLMATYSLARIGHPTSVWLWRDVLGRL